MFPNDVSNGRRGIALLAVAFFCLAGAASAQQNSAGSDATQANNPLARFTAFNVFIEPQYSIADKGAGYPKWQVFIGFNTQFK